MLLMKGNELIIGMYQDDLQSESTKVIFLLWFSLFVFTISFSVLASYLPPDIILIPEYDPSVDMDEKCKRMKPVDIDAIVEKAKVCMSKIPFINKSLRKQGCI